MKRRKADSRKTRHVSHIAVVGLLAICVLACSLPLHAQESPDASTSEATTEANESDPIKLPWTEQQEQLRDLPARRMTHAKELLNLLNIDDSRLANFTDGEPLGAQDEETVVRLLYQMPRIPLNDLYRWAKPIDELETLLEAPSEHRADTILLRGQITQVEQVSILPEVADRLEFAHYYRVSVALTNSQHTAVICVRKLPAAWTSKNAIGEPIESYALFLKVGESVDDSSVLNFATPHIAWLPKSADPTKGITKDLAHLASLGMDVSLFDDVRDSNRKPITQTDRECFYQLLHKVGNTEPSNLRTAAENSVDLAALLQDPTSQHGRLMVVRGTARRAMNIRVDDRDIQERFGIDHYYQIDVFIPLGDQVVRLGKQENGASPTFTNNFPVTVCVTQLPPDLTEGADIRQEVSIPAAHFKVWAYRSRFVSSFDQNQLQISPMFIGAEPQVIELVTETNPYVSIAVGGGFVTLLAVIWIALWRSNRSDSKFKKRVLSRRREVSPDKSLNDAGIEEADEPDFSQWE